MNEREDISHLQAHGRLSLAASSFTMLTKSSLPLLTKPSLPLLTESSLPPIPHELKISVVKAGEHLIKSNGTRLECWRRQEEGSWIATIPWHDGTDDSIQLVHMQLVDRTLVLILNTGQVQLWKLVKSVWERQLDTTFLDLDVHLAASNKRSFSELASEHKYNIALAIAVVVAAGAYYVHQKQDSKITGNIKRDEENATQGHSVSSDIVESPLPPPEQTPAELEHNVNQDMASSAQAVPVSSDIATKPLEDYKSITAARYNDEVKLTEYDKPLNLLNDNTLPSKSQNSAAPDKLKDLTKSTAQDINKAVYNRRHRELSARYAKDLQNATNRNTKAEINNKIKSLHTQEFMDTVAMFSRKDGSEVFVVGNIKTRSETAKDPGKIKYAAQEFGWSLADKGAVIDTIRSKPEFRDAKIKIIDTVGSASNAQQNAVRHAEMQFMSHCKQANLNHKEYVGGISKPACVSCDQVLSGSIRAVGDGIVKNAKGVDHIPNPSVADAYSGRKLSRYAVKDQDWVEPASIGATHEVVSSKKKVTHNITKDNLYSAKPVLIKPDIRKATIQSPKETLVRQTPKSVHKNVKKHVNANASVGSLIENIIENHDRPSFAEAKTLIHNKPHTYRTRSTVGAQASLHTARAHAHASVAHARAEGPNLSCGAHTGPSGASAYASAEVCRAEAGVPGITVGAGLTAKTGVSVGLGGFSLDILGFGFTIGPKMRIATPFADLAIG